MARSLNAQYATSRDLAEELIESWKNDWPLTTLEDVPQQILESTNEVIARIAASCQKNCVIGALGDAARINAAWLASGAQR